MATSVPQPPTGGTAPHTQAQCTEQHLPSKEFSSSTDKTDNANLVRDMAEASFSESSDKDEMTLLPDASPLVTHSTQPHSRSIKHIARKSSSVQGDPSSGFTFGKAQSVRADLMGKFKPTTPLGNPQDPTPPSAQSQPIQGSTGLDLNKPPVAQGKHNNSPMKIPFPEPGNQKISVNAEAPVQHASVTSRPLSRRAQDTAATRSRLDRSQRAKTDDVGISTGLSNRVLADVDPNARKAPTPQQGKDSNRAVTPAVKETSNDQIQRVDKKRRHKSGALLVNNRPAHHDAQVQIQVLEAYHDAENRFYLLAQQHAGTCSLLEELEIEISAKEDTIQTQKFEITECDDALQELYQMYQDQSKLLEQTEAALARLQQKKPEWEDKVKRLSHALKGLCNDHNNLRETGDKLRARTDLLDADEESIRETLMAIQASNDADRAKAKDIASKHHKHIESLERTILSLQSQKASSPQDAEAEQEKSARLQAELTKITNSHEKMREEYAKGYSELNTKLETLSERPQVTNTIVERTTSDSSSPQLEECLAMLRAISQQEHVRPSDLAKLEVSMGQYTQSVKDSIQEYTEKTDKANATAQNLAFSVQAELQAMSGNIVKAEDLREQVAEHRETKASLAEQLQATKLRLVETQVRLGSFEEKDRDNRQRIQGYEAELKQARENSRDPPAIMLRLHDLDQAKSKAENEKAAMSHELQQMHQEMRRKENDISNLQAEANGLQSEIERMTKAEEKLRNGHATLQKQMEQDFEVEKRKIVEFKDREAENSLLDVRNEKQQLLYGERQQKEAMSKLEREKHSAIAANRALRDTVKTLEAKLEDGPAQAKIKNLTEEVKNLRGQNEDLEEIINASDQDKQENERLQHTVKTLTEKVNQAPSPEKHNALKMLVQDLQAEIGTLQGQVNRAQSESKSRKQEIKQLKASSTSATSHQVTAPTADADHGRKQQRRIIGDSQGKEKDAGRDFQEILSSQSDEQEEPDITGLWPASPKAPMATQQQAQTRISLPPKKAVRVQTSSGRMYNPSTPRSSSGGEDVQQPPKTKGILRVQPAAIPKPTSQSNGSNTHDQTDSQETISSQGSSQQAKKSKVVVKPREPLPEDPEARRNLERMAHGALNLKRDPTDADLDAHVATGSKKSKIRISSTLGPVVADSQSPNRLLNGRGRKVSSTSARRQSYKESAMTARFKAERERVD